MPYQSRTFARLTTDVASSESTKGGSSFRYLRLIYFAAAAFDIDDR